MNNPKNDFDTYKDRYQEEVEKSIAFIRQDLDFFTEVKARNLIELAKRHFLNTDNLKVLDVGCGEGKIDRLLFPVFKNLYGIDISKSMLEKSQKNNPSVNYQLYDGNKLPFSDCFFDVVFTICVMHHIPPLEWNNFIGEIYRITKKGGLVVIFEHNPFNPLTRLAVNRCEFDAGTVLLRKKLVKSIIQTSGFALIDESYILFFPFRGSSFEKLERILKWLPFGAQYYVAGKK